MSIQADANGWILETAATGYAFGLNEAGLLTHRYWGSRLPYLADYPLALNPPMFPFNGVGQLTPEEYPADGAYKFIEPCLRASFADGGRDLLLKFDSASLADDDPARLDVHLSDAYYPLRVTLHYRVHEAYDLIERYVTFTNDGGEPITLERMWSAEWHLPLSGSYRLTHVTGRWLNEMTLRREPLLPGVKVVESRRLTTSHHNNPWFAVDRGSADEDQGEVWFGVLAWSGNWKLAAEVTDFGSTRVNIGLNDYDSAWRLAGRQSFTTPSSYAGYSTQGFGGASCRLHDFTRERLLPHGQMLHKILYNSWEATTFDVSEAGQAELAELAAAMGIELFVMDDGWFQGRDDDRAGLGDWWPDARKFPAGLGGLIRQVNDLGMDFGLWIEPEMVNPNSDLYRAHPDWVIHFPNRPRTESRNQLILNLGRTDVQDYLIGLFDTLLTENNIAFIKWDMNRNVSEPGWPDAPGDARELWIRYVYGVYRLWDTLRQRHPNVIWQSCSGGGGRADLGILQRADQIWVSDNTEATARLGIQEGFSHIFPPNTMEAWVTDSWKEHISLEFRFHASMCGTLGVGGHLKHWSEADRALAARQIARYKDVRHIIQLGDVYRLRSPQANAFSAVQYVSKNRSESVLFAFRTHLPEITILPPIYLRGLDPDALYEIEGIEGQRSGAAWMRAGVQILLTNFASTVRYIRRV